MATRESRPQGAAPESPTTATSIPGHCQACGVDPPPGDIYCSRVCAMWDRREYLDDEAGRSS
jgi:hypothetical protein